MSHENNEEQMKKARQMLRESICEISDAIGFAIEVTQGQIPVRHIDANSLMEKLLHDGMIQVSSNLKALSLLDDLNSDTSSR